MTDPLSFPKLPVNIEEMVVPSKERIARSLRLNNSRTAGRNESEMRNACTEMESLFIQHLLKEMRATIQKTGFISGGQAEEIYTSMLDAEVAAQISTRGGIGLADMLLQQLGEPPSRDEADESDGP
jgi:Rod binding domain-containing protein